MPGAVRGSALVLVALGLSAGGGAQAQVSRLPQAQVLSLAVAAPNVLGVTVTSGASQSIASLVDNSLNYFPLPVALQTNWNLNPGQTTRVDLVAYFSVPTQALTGGGSQIPSSRVLGRVTSGLPTTYTAMSQGPVAGVGTAGGTLHLFTQAISGANKVASRSDNLDLALDLVGFPTASAGTYSGTLTLEAVTQ